MFRAGTTPQLIVSQMVKALTDYRNALSAIKDVHAWAAGVSPTDILNFAGNSIEQDDANWLLSAVADAAAHAQIFDTGLPPGTYPQPPSAYVYGQSVRYVIGPKTV